MIALVASAVSMVAAVVLLPRTGALAPGRNAVVGAWLLMQTPFSFHSARLSYEDDGPGSGHDVEGGRRGVLDLAHVAFGIGMTYQVADVVISGRAIRHTVLVHALLSFAFTTTMLALVACLLLGRPG